MNLKTIQLCIKKRIMDRAQGSIENGFSSYDHEFVFHCSIFGHWVPDQQTSDWLDPDKNVDPAIAPNFLGTKGTFPIIISN